MDISFVQVKQVFVDQVDGDYDRKKDSTTDAGMRGEVTGNATKC